MSVVEPILGGMQAHTLTTLWTEPLAVFDLETTGIDVTTSRIVSANISVLSPEGAVLKRKDWLADPGVEIPAGATAVHGITTEHARSAGQAAPTVVADVIETLRRLLSEGTPVVIYNAPYDLSLLAHEARRYGFAPLESPSPIIDPLVIDKAVDRYRKGKRTLQAAAEFYGVDLTDAHNAGSDAIAAGRVAQAVARAHPIELALHADELHRRQIAWCQNQSENFQDYMRRTKDPHFVASGSWPIR